MELLSIVVPCFNEEATIPIFYETVEKIKKQIPAEVEYCFIDDGSRDRTLPILRELNKKSGGYVHYRSFSRNFGKEAALYAGLKMAKGDYIVTMDVDLQDPPSLLPEMWKILHDPESDYDCVATRRTTRKGEPPIRSFFARLFYRLINELSDTEIVDGARDYRMMTRQMVDAVIHDSEYNRFSKGIFSWVGFHTKWLAYENVERSAGETKWSFWKLFKYSIEGILAYTTVPLYLSSIMGIIMCGVSFLALMFILIRAMIYGDPVAGWPSLVCIITLLGGLVLLALGIMGLYIAKIYLETKKRQIFIVREEA
ncbi:glycosyltransferase family 2 protein [Dialister succinatiphilus]|uniref:glycosyltransferase family 2 protein n=1 Tax=Dialister succinatiphilus TaxID=487173 RepID=UPI003FEE58A5